MKSFHNILLFSDVDGTIAWSSEYINPKNFDAIRYFINHGGHFAFSSGRNHKDIFHILPNLKELVNMPCILCNGSYLYDANTGDILNPQYLDSTHAVKLLREVNHDFPDVGFRVTVRGGFLVPSGNVYPPSNKSLIPGTNPFISRVARKESILGIAIFPTTVKGICLPPSYNASIAANFIGWVCAT